MRWWCTDNAQITRKWYSDDALLMHWWCADDALMMHWWCTDDALMMCKCHIWYPWNLCFLKIQHKLGLLCCMIIWWSSYEDMMTMTWCQDLIITENVWFAWSNSSYSGDKWRCHRCGTNDERTREDSATQPMDSWKAESRNFFATVLWKTWEFIVD